MKLFYTNSYRSLEEQNTPDRSVGGFVSTTPVPNDWMNNLFGDISVYAIDTLRTDTKALALKNIFENDVDDIKLVYVYPKNCAIKLEVAAVEIVPSDCGNVAMEQLTNLHAKPIYAQFVEANADYATASIDITIPAEVGDTIDVLIGGEVVATTQPITASTVFASTQAVADAINTTEDFRAEIVTDKSGWPTVLVTKKAIGVFTDVIELDTDGSAFAEPVSFYGGFDNTVLLGGLEKGKYLGLWFRRTIVEDRLDTDLEAQMLAEFESGKKHKGEIENISIEIEWTDVPEEPTV